MSSDIRCSLLAKSLFSSLKNEFKKRPKPPEKLIIHKSMYYLFKLVLIRKPASIIGKPRSNIQHVQAL